MHGMNVRSPRLQRPVVTYSAVWPYTVLPLPLTLLRGLNALLDVVGLPLHERQFPDSLFVHEHPDTIALKADQEVQRLLPLNDFQPVPRVEAGSLAKLIPVEYLA